MTTWARSWRTPRSPAIPGSIRKLPSNIARLSGLVEKYREYQELRQGISEAKQMKDEGDADMRAMADEELLTLEARLPKMEEDLKLMLLPKDPNDEKNVVLEIRAGTGGDEATLFAAEMFRMYTRFAETQRWRVEVLSTSRVGVGGLKEVMALIEGDRVYSQTEVRERRASRAARSGDGDAGSRAYLRDHGGGAAGS